RCCTATEAGKSCFPSSRALCPKAASSWPTLSLADKQMTKEGNRMPQNRRKSRGGSAPLTPKQKQAAIVLAICALVLVITIAVVSVVVSKAGGGDPQSGSTSQTSSGTSQVVT